jgi:hypothetical protein
VYGNVHDLIPTVAPEPFGNCVTTVTYSDDNLNREILTIRSVTGILHLCNQTLIDWYSKRQVTVETATLGSEFTAARTAVDKIIDLRTAVDKIIDLRTTLRYLGIHVNAKSFMFGDIEEVVTNVQFPTLY